MGRMGKERHRPIKHWCEEMVMFPSPRKCNSAGYEPPAYWHLSTGNTNKTVTCTQLSSANVAHLLRSLFETHVTILKQFNGAPKIYASSGRELEKRRMPSRLCNLLNVLFDVVFANTVD